MKADFDQKALADSGCTCSIGLTLLATSEGCDAAALEVRFSAASELALIVNKGDISDRRCRALKARTPHHVGGSELS